MLETIEKEQHSLNLLIRVVVRDPDGKVLSDSGHLPARSFVIQFLELLHFLFDAPAAVTATDVANAETFLYGWHCHDTGRIDAGINTSPYGIVVGTGDTAVDNADYSLETQLTEGTGAGNITHGASVFEVLAIVGSNVDLVVKRSFTNNTGSTITIKEAGIYTKQMEQSKYHCIVRDVLGTPVECPDNCSLTVYYTFRTTV